VPGLLARKVGAGFHTVRIELADMASKELVEVLRVDAVAGCTAGADQPRSQPGQAVGVAKRQRGFIPFDDAIARAWPREPVAHLWGRGRCDREDDARHNPPPLPRALWRVGRIIPWPQPPDRLPLHPRRAPSTHPEISWWACR